MSELQDPNSIDSSSVAEPAAVGPAAEFAAETRPLLSGQAIVALVVGLSVCMAAAAWLWHYETRRVPQTFWGFESPRVFREAKTVTAYLLRPEEAGATEQLQYYDNLFLIDDARYVIVKQQDVSGSADLGKVRDLLNNYANYGRSEIAWSNPTWRFALEFHLFDMESENPGNYRAMIVFDQDCKLGRPQTVEKTIQTDRMSADLLGFFERVFPEAKEMQNQPSSIYARPLSTGGPTPGANPTATEAATTGPSTTGPSTAGNDVDVITLPTPDPAPTGPRIMGPAVPDFSQPRPPAAAPTPSAVASPSGTPPAAPIPTATKSPFNVGPGQLPAIPGLTPAPTPGLIELPLPGSGAPPPNPLLPTLPTPGGVGNPAPGTITLPPLKGAK